jgi:5-formyltetrahydrofolate cyclo-ligase
MIADAKAALRKALQARRAQAAADAPDAAADLARHFPYELLPPPPVVVSGFVRFRTEIDPSPLLRELAQRGYALTLPRIVKGAGLVFARWAPGDPIAQGGWGVPKASEAAERVAPDVILAPMLGFDRTGMRLGYGKGHYDRAIARLRAEGRAPLLIGVAFAAQEVGAVPAEPHDARLDFVVTERGLVRF